jgi:hypothetical protein
MASLSNNKKCVDEPASKAERNEKGKPRRKIMSTTSIIVVCTIIPLLLSGFLNHFSHKNWILYFPLIGIALAVVYFGHLGIRSRGKTSASGKQERPYVSISAIGLPNIVLGPGPLKIRWEIKNNVAGPQIAVIAANMTTWFETSERPLPETPEYVETPRGREWTVP